MCESACSHDTLPSYPAKQGLVLELELLALFIGAVTDHVDEGFLISTFKDVCIMYDDYYDNGSL